MKTRSRWIVTFALGACICWAHLGICRSALGQTPGVSPGPSGALSGKDHRVRLGWLSQPGDYRPGNYGRKFTLGGRERYYEIHVPLRYKPRIPTPVVFVLHGGGGFAGMMRSMSNMDELSDQHGFIVVYCAGTNKQLTNQRLFWNVRGDGEPDDIGYIKSILEDLPRYFAVDKNRIYAVGTSNGAQMTFRIGAELSEHFAAIATVAGQRGPLEFGKGPDRPLPLIHFHGRHDSWCPIEGGKGIAPRDEEPYQFQSVDAVIKAWAKHNRSESTPEVSLIGKAARRHVHKATERGVDTVLWILEDAGHTWPGGPPPSRFQISRNVGDTNRDISASELMWEFLQRHSLDRNPR